MSRTLIIVDLQKGFVTPVSEHVVKPIEALQEDFDHVVITRFSNPDDSAFRRILDYKKLPPGHADTEFSFAPRKDAIIIDRPLYTCLTRELHEHLKKTGAKEAYVCGIATEACVLKTALDLFEADVRPIIIADLCASDQDTHYHRLAIELLEKLVGKKQIITSRDL